MTSFEFKVEDMFGSRRVYAVILPFLLILILVSMFAEPCLAHAGEVESGLISAIDVRESGNAQPSSHSCIDLVKGGDGEFSDIQGIHIVRKSATIKAGKELRLRVKTNAGKTVKATWSISKKRLASISAKGLMKAKLPGTVKVTARFNGLATSVRIKIKPKGIVAIDPGHSSCIPRGTEPIAPGSFIRKAKDNYGAAGRYTRVPEYKVVLKVALKLKNNLEKRGYEIVLTRKSNLKAISCKNRALVANRAKADIFIRLHCDGSGNSSVHGISMQSPGKKYRWARKNHKKVARLSSFILRSTCKATGASSKGVFYRNDLTGNNWAKMPVTLIEMGFMSNLTEDRRLARASYQGKLAKGIASGIDKYFRYYDRR